ncbi:hypothetical protein WICPIJ_002052, partial [Wickerhamomyces pijperi]
MVRTNNLLTAAAVFATSTVAQSNTDHGIVLDGVLNAENAASFDLSIPSELGPWNAVGVDDNKNLALGFDLSQPADFNGDVVVTAVIDINKDLVIAKRDDAYYTVVATATRPASSGASSASASASGSEGALVTSTATEDDVHTTVVTITSCHDNACSESAVTTGYKVVTTTEESEVTSYTTYCPLTASTTTEEAVHTTVVTITSCHNDACHLTSVTTGYEVVTTTEGTEVTTY